MKRLVVVCAGPGSLHEINRWTRRDLRTFTLWIIWYGEPSEAFATETADRVFFDRGSKWDLIRRRAADITASGATWIWLPDDDLALHVEDVNLFFDMCEDQAPGIAQPSLVPRNASVQDLIHVPQGEAVRFTRFVEIQMPCFSSLVWPRVVQLLEENPDIRSGWGFDIVWSRWPYRKVVHNATVAFHTRAVNIEGGFYKALGIDPCEERELVLKKYTCKK
jgi:hypothetical protein